MSDNQTEPDLREGVEALLAAHQIIGKGMTGDSPDECVCGDRIMPDARIDFEDISERRHRAFAAHQADAVLALIAPTLAAKDAETRAWRRTARDAVSAHERAEAALADSRAEVERLRGGVAKLTNGRWDHSWDCSAQENDPSLCDCWLKAARALADVGTSASNGCCEQPTVPPSRAEHLDSPPAGAWVCIQCHLPVSESMGGWRHDADATGNWHAVHGPRKYPESTPPAEVDEGGGEWHRYGPAGIVFGHGAPARIEDGMTAMTREMHEHLGAHINDGPPSAAIPDDLRQIRIDLLTEEVREYIEAAEAGDLVGIADGLADVVYVAYGTAHTYGIPLDAVLAEVHRSNMTKSPNPNPAGGKFIKGADYSPPDIGSILATPSPSPTEGES